MSWSISQVAKLSGTTSRTLRHYDAIGLLPPAAVGANGYRYYERADLLRLQEILLLRELGLSLDSIAEIIQGRTDQRSALKHHREWLIAERDRMDQLVATIDSTITELEGGEEMSSEDLFKGFEENPYEAEAVQRWGQETIDASKARYATLTDEQKNEVMHGWVKVLGVIDEKRRAGVDPSSEEILDAVDVHRQWLELSWTPNAESYTGLGRMYADDERFRVQIDADGRDGLADYLAEAMATYAIVRLT